MPKKEFDLPLGVKVRATLNGSAPVEGILVERGVESGKKWFKVFEYPGFIFDTVEEITSEEE